MSTTAASDDTLAIAKSLPAPTFDVQVVSLSRNFGKEAALLAGLDHARLGAVLFIDGDGQHPPALIETLVGHWLDDGYDVVFTAKAHRSNESAHQAACGERVLCADQLGRAPENSAGCRRLPPAVAARRGGAAPASRTQPLLQGTRDLDRLSPDPRRLQPGAARTRQDKLGHALADRPVGRRADIVFGGAVAARQPAWVLHSPLQRCSSAAGC